MAGYGYATQAVDGASGRAITSTDTNGDNWVLSKFSRVLALAFGRKLWSTKPVQPAMPFGEVIERVKQAQAEDDEKRATPGSRPGDARNR